MSDELDLAALFAQEAAGLLDRLAQGALELERLGGGAEPDPELVAGLFRAAHTLKGSAGLVGLDAFAQQAHALEDVLADVRAGKRPAGPEVVDAILATVDALRAQVPVPGADPEREPAAPAREAGGATSTPPAPPSPPAEDLAIPVGRERLDRMVRLAGEARTARLRLERALGPGWDADPQADAAMADLERALSQLQRHTLQARMVTLERIAEPLRRAVRDVARDTGKDVDYALEGGAAELDRAVLEALREPLLHLLRNAVDHGLELPRERVAAGKPATGTVRVRARRHDGDLIVEVADDGRGLDPDRLRAALPDAAGLSDAAVIERLFEPGVSTAGDVTALSGRGVGLDAVRSALARVRGSVHAEGEPGRGTTFVLTVPVALELLRCVLVRVGTERYAVPGHAVAQVAEAAGEALVSVEGGPSVWAGGELLPVADLAGVVGTPDAGDGGEALVLTGVGRRLAIRVDEVLGHRELTVQDLGAAVGRLELVAGAAVDADGRVLLVLDPAAVALRAGAGRTVPDMPALTELPVAAARPGATVLVVDDAPTVRALERGVLERAGYSVLVAEDGREALEVLGEVVPDAVLTDLEMPGMDGFALLRAMRERPALSAVPVLVVSSWSQEADRRRALDAGATAFLAKQELDERSLLAGVGLLLGEVPDG